MKTLFFVLTLLCPVLALAQSPVFIDVRSADEYSQGHVEGARLIPHEEIVEGIAQLEPGMDTPLYLYCRSGRRAGMAAEELRELGYTRVVNLRSLENAQRTSNQMQLCARSSDAPGCNNPEMYLETVPAT